MADRFQKSIEVPQRHSHQGVVDFTAFGRQTEEEDAEHPERAQYGRLAIYTGCSTTHISMTESQLRALAVLLVEAADSFVTEPQ